MSKQLAKLLSNRIMTRWLRKKPQKTAKNLRAYAKYQTCNGLGLLDVDVAITLARRNLEKALVRHPDLPVGAI